MGIAKTIAKRLISNIGGDPEKKAKLVDSIAGGLDRVFTGKNELKEIELGLDAQEMKEVTERHSNDMQSDNWLSKNVRPMIAIITLALTLVFTALDSITALNFDVPEYWVKLWVTIFTMIIAFYFGSRGAEKLMKIWANRK